MRRQSEHFGDYSEARSSSLERRAACLSLLLLARRHHVRRRAAAGAGRATPTARRSMPAPASICRRRSATKRLAAGEKASYRLDMDRALLGRRRDLTWSEYREWRGRVEVQAADAQCDSGATPCSPARTSRRATISPWSSTTPLQGVTDVVRGEDLFMATSLHRMLQDLLDLPAPSYHHHTLLRDIGGSEAFQEPARQVAAHLPAGGPQPSSRRARPDRPCRTHAMATSESSDRPLR